MRVKSERNERVTDKSTNVVEDKTPLLITDRTSRQNISKDLKEMNKTINERDKNDTYKNTSPKELKCTKFSRMQGTFTMINHI